MSKEEIETTDDVTVTLNLDDGDVECSIVGIFAAGDREYIALLPMEGPDAETGEVYLYRYTEVNGEPELENIEDDDEFEIASDAFDEFLDSAEFDEIVSDEEDI